VCPLRQRTRDRGNCGTMGDANLTALDYVILAVYLVATVGIGVWAGKKKMDNTDDFFLAGRNAHPVTVAISLVSGLTSGISFLGSPGYSYQHGIGIGFMAVGILLSMPIILWVIIPFYGNVNSPSAYGFLEDRFSRVVRTIAVCLFLCRVTMYLAIVLLAPALAIHALTGFNEILIVVVCGVLATAFTLKGGMNSVIWTDFMQSIVLVGGAAVALIYCWTKVPGGFPGGFNKSEYLRVPEGFWGIPNGYDNNMWFFMFGAMFQNLGQSGADQIAIQRYLSTDPKTTQQTAAGGAVLNTLMSFSLSYLGVALYAYYADSSRVDPLCSHPRSLNTTCVKAVEEYDQLLPYFFMNDLPNGVAGIMIAAVLGCTMSVFSAGINAATTCTLVDIMQNLLGLQTKPERTPSAEALLESDEDEDAESAHQEQLVYTSRIITACFGVLAIGMAMLSTVLGKGLVAMCVAVLGLTLGPVLGIFFLGMLTIRVGEEAALLAFLFGISVMSYLSMGQAICTTDDPCTGFLYFANLNEFAYTPTLTILTMSFGYTASFVLPAPKAGKCDSRTMWTQKTKSEVFGFTEVPVDGGDEFDTLLPEEPGISPTKSRPCI